MSEQPKIPGVEALPSLAAVKDPAVRAYLQSLTRVLNVRNGVVGDGDERFLTLRDLKDGIQVASRGSSGSVNINTAGVYSTSGNIANLMGAQIQKIIDGVTTSKLWRRITDRIDKIETPEWFDTKVGAAIKTEQLIRNEQNERLAKMITSAIASMGSNISQVHVTIKAVTDQASSTASVVTNLQTEVGGAVTNAQQAFELAQTLDTAVSGSWTVKFTGDGWATGFGLGLEGKNGTVESNFFVLANKFVIGTPGTNLVPFLVSSVGGNPVIALNGQVYIGARSLEEIATATTIVSIGEFSSAPATTTLKAGSVYKNTVDGNTYILNTDGGSWSLWLAKGASGANGFRGSMTFYVSGSVWTDAAANAAVVSVTGSSAKTVGDTVTISNGSSFAVTKYWSGLAWVSPGVVIDGNLLVSGTLSASKLGAGEMAVNNITMSNTAGTISFGQYNSGYIGLKSQVASSSYWGFWTNGCTYANEAIAARFSGGSFEGTRVYVIGNNYDSMVWGAGNSSAHGVRGQNTTYGTSGIVGASNSYDFYADGSGTNFGPFTGAHDALLDTAMTAQEGDIMVDVECAARLNISNTIFKVMPSSVPNQRGAVGVTVGVPSSLDEFIPAGMRDDYPAYCALRLTHGCIHINAVGEGQINVCGEGGNIAVGDLIVTSSIAGKGMRQSDDVVRSYTVARAREAVSFSYPNEVKQVACIYLCG